MLQNQHVTALPGRTFAATSASTHCPQKEIDLLGRFLLLPDVERLVLASSWSILLLNLSRIETADFLDIQDRCVGTKTRLKIAPIPRNR